MSLLFFCRKALIKGCFVTGKTPKFNVCAANLKIELESCRRRFRRLLDWSPKKVEFFFGDQYGPLYCTSIILILKQQTFPPSQFRESPVFPISNSLSKYLFWYLCFMPLLLLLLIITLNPQLQDRCLTIKPHVLEKIRPCYVLDWTK